MTSKLIVNNIEADAGVSTITFGSEISASTFTGNLTGNVTGNLTGNVTGNVTSSSTSTFSSGLNVTGGSVGIGTDNPGRLLQVYNASSNPQVNIKAASGGTCELQFGDTADEVRGNIVYNCTDDYLSLHGYNNAERLRITSAGNVGIKVTEPDLTLHVNGTNALPSSSGSTPTGHLTLRNKQGSSSHGMFMGVSNAAPWSSWIQAQDANNNATNYPLLLNPNGGNIGIGIDNPASLLHLQGSAPRITFTDTAGTDDIGKIFSSSGALYLQQRDGSAHGEIIFRTENNATAAERLRITNTGNVQIANGNLVFSTSGTGIDFSATANGSGSTSSELLDDYEEGGWTPTLGNTGTITAGTAEGIYTKIGNVCIARVRIDNATFGGSPNDEIRGLPFAAQQRSTTTQVIHANAFTAETIAGLVIQSNTYIAMLRNPTSGSGFWSGATIQTGTTKYIYCTLIYTV